MTADRYAVADDLGTLAGLADDLRAHTILGRLLRMYANDLRAGTLNVDAAVTMLRDAVATYPEPVPCGAVQRIAQEHRAALVMAIDTIVTLTTP